MSRVMSSVHIDTGLEPRTRPALARAAANPFRIVLLGDFGGRACRNEPRLLRDPILIDPGNFEAVMERLGAGLEISAGGVPLTMRFRGLNDFSPGHLYRTLQVFESLRNEEQAAAGGLMRAILGHPRFQALESAWRSISFLLQRLPTGEELKLYLIDITREEMLDATGSGHPQLIAREGWSAAACLHSFCPTPQDCAALACLAGLARKAGGPLLAGIDPRLLGCESMAATPDPGDWTCALDAASLQAWRELRRHPDARWIGLAMPRILLRLPYGRDNSAGESFAFEEMPEPPVHEAYLWGSPAVACVCLLGQAFGARGWQMYPGLRNQLDGMPVHNYRVDGEARMTPAAEALLTDYAAEKILAQGVMPLVSSNSSGSIRLVQSQSIADPPRALAGAWN